MTTAPVTSANPRRVALHLEPLDVLFFRDGRPFTAASHGSSTCLPAPQTLAGAIRSLLLRERDCDFQKLAEAMKSGAAFADACETACGAGWIGRVRVRGPWFASVARSKEDEPLIYVAAPAALHQAKDPSKTGGDHELIRLDPLGPPSPDRRLPGWKPTPEGACPLWPRQYVRSERLTGYLTPNGLAAFLAGDVPTLADVRKLTDFAVFDHRTGIGVEPDRLTAEESLLYSASFLTLHANVMLYAEVDLPANAPSDALINARSMPLGGEGRQVRVHAGNAFNWQRVQPAQVTGPTTALLITPGIFRERWRPACFDDGARLIAAAVPGHEAVSGWDLARGGPKPNRFAAPAGSVYFVETDTNQLELPSLADDEEDRLQGWGCFLKGAWKYV